MQTFSANFQAALAADPVILSDVYEVYAADYVPAPGAGFDPAAALYRFAGETITWNSLAYRRAVIDRGDINLSVSQEQNSVSLTFSNVDRYIATLAQTVQLEGCWLLVRTIAKLSGSFVTDDSRVWFTGKLGKPSTITKQSFSIEARQDFGDINVEVPTSRFVTEDPEGRLPSDPLFEGFRFHALSGAYTYEVSPGHSGLVGALVGGLLGYLLTHKKRKTATQQYSSTDNTPYGEIIPEVFGSCQMPGIPIAFYDSGGWLQGLWVWCKGKIDSVYDLKIRDDGFFGLYDVQHHIGALGGTGAAIVRNGVVPQTGGNITEDFRFPGSGLFSQTAFSGVSILQGNANAPVAITSPPTMVALIRGRIVELPDADGDYTVEGWSDNPVHIARFILSNERFVGINSGLLDDASNYLTGLLCDAPILNDSDDQHILISDVDFASAGVQFNRYRSTGLINSRQILFDELGDDSIIPSQVDGPYVSFAAPIIPIDPGECPEGFHRDPLNGTCVADDPTTGSLTALQPLLQKRFTANFPITDATRAIDFFYKTLAPCAKLYLRVNKQGRIGIFTEQAADNTRIRTAVAIGDTAVQVFDVLPWKTGPNLLAGRILIGTGLTTSEVRDVSTATYSTAGNAVTLTASATGTSTATASGATLSGGSTTVRASGTITLGGTPAQGNIVRAVINGVTVSYILNSIDTNQTAAAMLANYINAITRLTQDIEAVWDSASPLVITLRAKHGTLNLSSALLKTHSVGVADPTTAPTVANTASGSLDAGVYKVAYTNVTALGETCPTPMATVTLTASHKIGVSSLPSFPTDVTSRNFYISVAANSKTLRFVVNRTDAADFVIDVLPENEAALRPTKNTTAEELIRVAMSLATNSQDVLPGWKSSFVTSVIPVVLNDIYLPNVLNGHKYKATGITTGITGSSAPVWPLTAGGTVVDSGVTWTEFGETVLGQTGLTRANVIKDSYNWPMGSEQSTINQIKGEFIDRKSDFAKTQLIVNDREHQTQVGKKFPYDLDLSAVDSFNQANRLCNSALAKYRDGDWFNAMSTGPGVLSFGLEEGDVNCSSDDSGGLVNVLTRIESISIDKEHKVHINRARLYSTDMFSDDAEKHTTPIPTTLRFVGLADSVVEFIDNFAIRDADALVPGFYVAVSRDVTIPGEWRGWILYADYGDGYLEIARGDTPAIMGTCDTTLDTVTDATIFDTVSSVDFTLKFGPLFPAPNAFANATEAELLANPKRNLFIVGNEYLQAGTIVDNGAQSFTISDFLRGRFQTDTADYMVHSADERIVFLNGAEMFIPLSLDHANIEYSYKAVTINQDVADAASVLFTWQGNNVRGPLPSGFTGSFDLFDGALLMEWDGTKAIAESTQEAYELEIRDSGDTSTLRTQSVVPSLNQALTEYLIWRVTSDPSVIVTLTERGGINFAATTSTSAAVVTTATKASATGGLLVEIEVPADGRVLPTFFSVFPEDSSYNSGDDAFIWVVFFTPPSGPGLIGWSAQPETSSGSFAAYNRTIVAGDRLGIYIRPDGIAEYHLNYGVGSVPIYRSGKPVRPSVLYKVAIRQNTLDSPVPAGSGIKNASWSRQKPEWRYTAAAQVVDGVDGDSSIKARVRQLSFFVGGRASAWINGVFNR